MEAAGSSSLLIRAPVSSLDEASPPLSDEEFFLSGADDDDEEEEISGDFNPNLPPLAAALQKSSSMPKAPVTYADDDAAELLGAALAEYEAEFSSSAKNSSPAPLDAGTGEEGKVGEEEELGFKAAAVEKIKVEDETAAPAKVVESSLADERSSKEAKVEEEEELGFKAATVEKIKIEDETVALAKIVESSLAEERSSKEGKVEEEVEPVVKAASIEKNKVEDETAAPAKILESPLADERTGEESKAEEEEESAVRAATIEKIKVEDEPATVAAPVKIVESSLADERTGEENKVEEKELAGGDSLVAAATKEIKIEDEPATVAAPAKIAETPLADERTSKESEVEEKELAVGNSQIKIEDGPATPAKIVESPLADEMTSKETKVEVEESPVEASPISAAIKEVKPEIDPGKSAVPTNITESPLAADEATSKESKVEGEESPVEASQVAAAIKEIKLEDDSATPTPPAKSLEASTGTSEENNLQEKLVTQAPPPVENSQAGETVKESNLQEDLSAVVEKKIEGISLPGVVADEGGILEKTGEVLVSDKLHAEAIHEEPLIEGSQEKGLVHVEKETPIASPEAVNQSAIAASAVPGEEELLALAEEELAALIDGLGAGEKPSSSAKSLQGPADVEESHKQKPSEVVDDAGTTGEKVDFKSGAIAAVVQDGGEEGELGQVSAKDSKITIQKDVLPAAGDTALASLLNNGSHHAVNTDQVPIGGGSEASDAEANQLDEHDEDIKVESAAKSVALDNGSSAAARVLGSTDGYSDEADGQIVSYTDEEETEEDDDDDEDGKELFDSAALTALLKAASGASSNGEITFTAPDGTRIFSVDRPAGLGSSIPPLKPSAPRSARPSIFSPSDLSLTPEPEAAVDEEEKKLQEKVDQIKVKFLRLVHRLGHSPEDRVAAQVLYRLSLAEGIRRGRQIGRAFSLENAKKKALELEEAEGQEPLDFSCNILLLGKTGVGKSATINSIFGEKKVPTSAFDASTAAVREIAGTVDGVKVHIIDTPGLRASVMDQATNKKILQSIKKHTKRCPPDIVLYVDRLDTQAWDFNDLPLLRSIAAAMGPSVWFNAIVALTHGASAPPDGSTGTPLSYEVYVDQRSRVVQHAIRQAAGDMRLMNPVALVENHPSCRRNREGQPILPNGLSWRSQLLLLCYSSKILSEANRVLKLQDSSPSQLFGFRSRSPPLPFLLSSLLQSKPHPKLGADQGESDLDVEDLSEEEEEEEGEEDEYDRLPPFKPLRKAQLAKLTKEQRRAYFDEYDYRVKLLQKKQWKEEIRRAKEMKRREKLGQEAPGADDMGGDYDQDGGGAPATIPVPLPDMVLPPTFDGENPAYRYRFLEPSSQLLTRPVLDSHGWDHDCGYDGVSLEDNLAIAGKFPASVSAQITKDKKDFTIHLDSSIAAKHGDNGSTVAGFDIQSVGKQLAYILRSETKFKTLKKNRTAAGVSVTFLGENTAAGLKVEDELTVGKRLGLVASAGTMRSKGDAAYGANLEIRLRDREFPIGQDMSTLGLSLMRWRGDLALGANLQSQFSVGRGSKVAARVGLNNKRSGQITLRLNSSEQLQIALMGVIPIAASVYRTIFSED
ncbi:translocon at the outer envelope membrane of chloroplasts 159 isoform X2 [Wolffia australiana]